MHRAGLFLAALLVAALLVLLPFGAENVHAAPVSHQRARSVALNTLNLLRLRAGLAQLDPRAAQLTTLPHAADDRANGSLLHLVTFGRGNGFILLSGDDAASPVLGYSLHGSVDTTGRSLPLNLRSWLRGYRATIERAARHTPADRAEAERRWEMLEKGEAVAPASSAAVAPLLRTAWDQFPYANARTPFDTEEGEQTQAGCVATAMAQVMRYWNHPAQGTGVYSYPHDLYGTLSADFATTRYRWEEMPDTLSEPNDAVATLMFHCGIAAQTDYSPVESLASVIEMNTHPLKTCAETGLERFFGYDPATTRGLLRSDFTDEGWMTMMRNELDSGRPIIYDGFDGSGGHCFVLDGYEGEYFHVNWGWGGSFNGYFLLDAPAPDTLDPDSTAFSFRQEALIGIRPLRAAAARYDLRMNAPLVTLPAASLEYGDTLSITTDLINIGERDFRGDYGVAVFDTAGAFVSLLAVEQGAQLNGHGGHYPAGLTLDTSAHPRLLPGTYTIMLLSRPPGGEWSVIIGDTLHPNRADLTIINSSPLLLAAPLSITGSEQLERGGPLEVTTTLRNTAASAFRGDVALVLYALDGSPVATLQEEVIEIPANGQLGRSLHFRSDTLRLEPGTYLGVVMATPEGAGERLLVDGGAYVSPLPLIVKAFAPDRYEPNNAMERSASLSIPPWGGSATTTRANLHTIRDSDWYHVDVPIGRRYRIGARLYDAARHEDGNSYTNDVVFWTILEGDTSEEYDAEMPVPLIVEEGRTLYFRIGPYFDRDRGSYRLQVEVEDLTGSGVERSAEAVGDAHARPNPAGSQVVLLLPAGVTPRSITILNAQGMAVRVIEPTTAHNASTTIQLDGLPAGWYTLLAQTLTGEYRVPFVKGE